mmetsp:Transcript_2419/g.5750  ORF Transcript_2419/g.5750 Transcript_2419/m.5750 type:complete len:212 (+) Transcript_2419:419-1054(+)
MSPPQPGSQHVDQNPSHQKRGDCADDDWDDLELGNFALPEGPPVSRTDHALLERWPRARRPDHALSLSPTVARAVDALGLLVALKATILIGDPSARDRAGRRNADVDVDDDRGHARHVCHMRPCKPVILARLRLPALVLSAAFSVVAVVDGGDLDRDVARVRHAGVVEELLADDIDVFDGSLQRQSVQTTVILRLQVRQGRDDRLDLKLPG